ncbi:MAG: signal peptidase I [Alphaproteobacteria bacterium]|nr:signal peptidase I [Alphaproteobacteria bacterium]MCB1551699.1 signal peptidase I [Alphaproteobacteria bacterium]MCB9985707.1 signal peptidase I [Micavibrio sp.]HPQ50994.1 signal peptidase I [Alphaproteobacteria bacterium]
MTLEIQEDVSSKKEETLGETARTIIIALLLAMIVRTFLYEPFNIPSTSMVPNLLVGDYLFISKFSYGYSRHSLPFGIGSFDGRFMAKPPERGDVVVFKLPTDTNIDYIKRVIGLPGDTIQMINGRLYINDVRVERKVVGMVEYSKEIAGKARAMEYIETLPGGVQHTIYEESDNDMLDNTDKYTVPENHYFMMGDNRDNSRDSRVLDLVGYVPYDNLEGRAEVIFFSTDGSASLLEVWKWPWAVRYNRLFTRIGNGTTLKKGS